MEPSTLNSFVIAIAVLAAVQAIVLVALLIAFLQTRSRMLSVAEQFQQKALPVLESAQAVLGESQDKINSMVQDLSVIAASARGQMERLDATVNDIVDRTRLQMIRADELVSRTLDKVEETTEMVQHSVVSPIRQLAGVAQGVSAAVDALFLGGRRRARQREMRVPQDEELFI